MNDTISSSSNGSEDRREDESRSRALQRKKERKAINQETPKFLFVCIVLYSAEDFVCLFVSLFFSEFLLSFVIKTSLP